MSRAKRPRRGRVVPGLSDGAGRLDEDRRCSQDYAPRIIVGPFRKARSRAKGRASRPSEHRHLRAAPIFRPRKAARRSHVGLTCQHPNPPLLVAGPEVSIRLVLTREFRPPR
jgi:hypothetical protein